MDALEPELLAYGRDLLTEDVDTPVDVGRAVGFPAADLVVENNGPLGREAFERCEVVVRRAGAAVQREKRSRRRVEVSDEAVPRAVPVEVDVSLARTHRRYHPRTNALL